MEALARFAILPGAAELVEAFSSIPPGPMRDAVVHLAKTTAATYQGAPGAGPPPMDPLRQIGSGGPATRRRLPPAIAQSPDIQAVELRIGGMSPQAIGDKLQVPVAQVYRWLAAAKKAGAPIPKREKAEPADRADKRWITDAKDCAGQGLALMTKAAASRGVDLQTYLDRRATALRMAMAGHGYTAILKATGETDSKVVSAWLSVARQSGFQVPYITAVTDLDRQEPTMGVVVELADRQDTGRP
jgi:hypothetical protein